MIMKSGKKIQGGKNEEEVQEQLEEVKGYEPVSPSLPASRGSPSQRGQASTAAALLTGTSHLRSCPSHGPAIVRTRYPFLCYYPPPRFVLTQHEEPRHSLQALPDSCLPGHLHSPIPTPRHNLSRTSEPQQTLKTTPGRAATLFLSTFPVVVGGTSLMPLSEPFFQL
uniref:Uncharacterized protein n=1 Tax=Timema poppense TaxID=170557 RepID=A0A7R9GTK3_TIMPO|nr:unnamed protein product [Timema poppensis]